MNRPVLSPLLVVTLLALASVWSGCTDEPVSPQSNMAPNTRISAGPPEAKDTGYTVNLYWFGWDDDGFVDHYEIAWETPEEWIGPVFTSDSLFSVQASARCCAGALPEFGPPGGLRDSVYEQFHTFYIRAVDNEGVPDPTPAVRSFNAKTIAPVTRINFGPNGDRWGTDVVFKWTGEDDDGVVVAYRRALVNKRQFFWDNPGVVFTSVGFRKWIDTLTYVPIGPGTYKDSLVWEYSEFDSVLYPDLPIFDNTVVPPERHLYQFAVRAIDNAGAEERVLDPTDNVREFAVTDNSIGPVLFLRSNVSGSWRSGTARDSREVFAGAGIRFDWRAAPRQGRAVVGYSHAIEDTAQWTPFSLNDREWPAQPPDPEPEQLWFPDAGPHTFWVRAVDVAGFVSVLAADIEVFEGPRSCPLDELILLVVLDTKPTSLETNGVFPPNYAVVERALVDYWFQGYNYQIFRTNGGQRVDVGLLNCASSTFWFLSGDVIFPDPSVFDIYHRTPPNPLPSYVSSGGNLLICGIAPLNSMRWFDRVETDPTREDVFPINFAKTITDSTYVPHWAYTHLGIAVIENVVRDASAPGTEHLRIQLARSAVPGYPDLPFDPLSLPGGPTLRGFGFHDENIQPWVGPGGAEVVYKFNDTDEAIGIQRLTAPGLNGNTVYLGFHPYFVERPAFRNLVRAVLTRFGEVMTEP